MRVGGQIRTAFTAFRSVAFPPELVVEAEPVAILINLRHFLRARCQCAGGEVNVKSIRAPSGPVLIAAGIAFLLHAALGVQVAATVTKTIQYRAPTWLLAGSAIRNGILGLALIWVALSRSRYAGATAVVVGTLVIFSVASTIVTDMTFGLAFHPSWWTALDLTIATILLWSAVLPWNDVVSKPALSCMTITLGALSVLVSAVIALARL